eukprot:276133_1
MSLSKLINPAYYLIAFTIFSHIEATQFGFRVCSSSTDAYANSADVFNIVYQWGETMYECNINLDHSFDSLWTCDTTNLIPQMCAAEYGLQISATQAPCSNNCIDDLCVQSIVVNDIEISADPQRIGDDANDFRGSVAYATMRYYDLPNAPNALSVLATSEIVDSKPICYPVPTQQPTIRTIYPTLTPTDSPTNYPTDSPTTSQPTLNPTHHPTAYPTSNPTYPIYEPYTVNHYLCTNLVDNVGVFHGETFNQCIDECANCKMVNYFNYFKTNNDSRCYIFDKICNIQPDLHTNKSVIVFDAFFKECVDYPYDWIDNTADSCDHYVSYNWCNNGNILRQADDFNALVDIKYGLTAIQSCCKCGGGVKLFDDVEVSFDNDWTNVDILCSAFIHNDFTSQLNTQHESIRNWDNLILYELCQNLIDVDCEY